MTRGCSHLGARGTYVPGGGRVIRILEWRGRIQSHYTEKDSVAFRRGARVDNGDEGNAWSSRDRGGPTLGICRFRQIASCRQVLGRRALVDFVGSQTALPLLD